MKDCDSIKKQFSAYIDNELSSDEKLKIKGHLEICLDCAQELNELEKSINHLQRLDKVEPPPWLTKKVIDSIKTDWANIEASPKKSLFEKIFYPLYIKAPVGAIVAVFIAVVTIYIFKVIEPAMEYTALQEPPKENLIGTKPLLPSEQKAKEYVLGSRVEEDGKKPDTGEALKKELPSAPVMKDFEKPKTFPTALTGAVSAKSPEPPTSTKTIPETKSFKSAVQKLETGNSAAEQKEDAGALDKRSVTQGLALQEHYFYVTAKDHNAENKIIELIKKLDGAGIKQESSGNRIFISAEIQAAKLKELTDKLKVIGTVGEKTVSLGLYKDKIGVRIEILKIPD